MSVVEAVLVLIGSLNALVGLILLARSGPRSLPARNADLIQLGEAVRDLIDLNEDAHADFHQRLSKLENHEENLTNRT